MITEIIKQILVDSGCTLIVYHAKELVNLDTDQSDQFSIVGAILQPESIDLEVKANSIQEHYNPLTVEILQQVRMEDSGDNNDPQLEELLGIVKQIIVRVIATAVFKTQKPYRVTKIPEGKYDANVIGWSISLDLFYLNNETRIPCL